MGTSCVSLSRRRHPKWTRKFEKPGGDQQSGRGEELKRERGEGVEKGFLGSDLGTLTGGPGEFNFNP